MKRMRLLALLLALSVLLGVPAQAAEPILPQQEHQAVSMAELETLTFDMEAFRDLCGELESLCADRANYDQVEALLQELREAYLRMDTELTLCSLNSSKHAADEAAQAEYLSKLDQSYDVDGLMEDTVQAVLAGPCSRAVDQNDMVLSMFTWESAPMTDQEEQLYLEEQTLVDQYYSACQDASARYSDLGEIYVALVENRKRQAAMYGYEDYAQLADDYFFYRDYDREEIAAFSQAVKAYIVPLVAELEEEMVPYANRGDYDIRYSTEELLAMLRQGLETISGELLPTADYMTEFGYYDIDWSPDKIDGAYTTILTSPNAPYLLMQPEDGPWDFSSLVHEFGHYNAYFCSENVFMVNIDLSEIHSQGLELLMTRAYGDLFGEQAQAMELDTIWYVLSSLTDGCMMDELERYAYLEPDLTVEKLDRKYMELLKDYGYWDAADPAQESDEWVLTAHLYSDPLYYISYAVSAAGAFDIWERSLSDWDGAVETYLRLVALGEGGDFFDSLRRVGMENPISRDSVASLASLVRQEFGLAAAEPAVLEPETEPETELVWEPAEKQPNAPLEWSGGEGDDAAAEDALPLRTLVLAAQGLRLGGGIIVLMVVLVKRRKEKKRL